MKTNFYLSMLAGAAMVASLAACSNEDVASTPDVVTPGKANTYAKVAISMPNVPASRADEVFDAGTTAEATVKTIHLAFYDAYGTYVGNGELVSEMQDTPQGSTANVSDKYSKVFELNLIEGANDATQVVAFVNTDLQTKNLADLAAVDFEGDNVATAATGFPMTNAGYYDADTNGNFVVAAALTGDFYDSADAAQSGNTNATIYVERLAAKITVKKASEIQEDLKYEVKDVAGNTVKLTYTPTNWAPTGTAKKEYLVKKPFALTDASWQNAVSNHRSYWAEGVSYDAAFDAYYTAGAVPSTSPLDYVTFNDVKDEGSFDLSQLGAVGETAQYAPEHTTVLGAENENLIANTYALVVGTYAISGEGVDAEWFKSGEELDFFLLLTGMNDNGKKTYTIYNKSQLIGLLLSYNGVEEVATSEGGEAQATVVADNDFDFTEYLDLTYDADQGKYVLAEKADAEGTLYVGEEFDEELDIEGMTASTNSRNYHYENGAAYFNVRIPHNVPADESETTYGVVRNHSYVLTINKIENLGAPLDDNGHNDNDPIIPNPDDLKEHYIKAEINVLAWHQLDNNVTL